MANIFSSVQMPKVGRNRFDLSHDFKFSGNIGKIYPCLCEEIVPGDIFKVKTEALVRTAPLIAPLMHQINVYVHYFFVPNRLTWNEWREFITGGPDGTLSPVFPTINCGKVNSPDILDFLGVTHPSGESNSKLVSAIPARGYNLIWNEYYRDQNLQDPITFSVSSGFDSVTPVDFLYRCWKKDYFTSALPWTQRGPDVTLPISSEADVLPNDVMKFRRSDGGSLSFGAASFGDSTSDGNPLRDKDLHDAVYRQGLKVDITSESATINELRRSIKLQEWLERNARGGARYIEQIFSHFGVRSSDARLQRPEYLGGGKLPIMIGDVLQTSSTNSTSPQANMAGRGVAAGASPFGKLYAEEHGYLFAMFSILPVGSYLTVTRRHFFKFDKFDFYFPEFAHLGEQPVLNAELDPEQYLVDKDSVFGYQSRYAEYKYIPSTSHGDFKNSLSFWNMDRKISGTPSLNGDFVSCKPELSALNRVFAVTDPTVDHFYIQLRHHVFANRLMPVYGTPNI